MFCWLVPGTPKPFFYKKNVLHKFTIVNYLFGNVAARDGDYGFSRSILENRLKLGITAKVNGRRKFEKIGEETLKKPKIFQVAAKQKIRWPNS